MEDISAPYFFYFLVGKVHSYLPFEHKNSPFYVKLVLKRIHNTMNRTTTRTAPSKSAVLLI